MLVIKDQFRKTENKDTWVWLDEKGDKYSLRPAYKSWTTIILGNSEFFKTPWTLKVPSTQYFVWGVLLVRIPTKVNLELRGVVTGNSLCVEPTGREDC